MKIQLKLATFACGWSHSLSTFSSNCLRVLTVNYSQARSKKKEHRENICWSPFTQVHFSQISQVNWIAFTFRFVFDSKNRIHRFLVFFNLETNKRFLVYIPNCMNWFQFQNCFSAMSPDFMDASGNKKENQNNEPGNIPPKDARNKSARTITTHSHFCV